MALLGAEEALGDGVLNPYTPDHITVGQLTRKGEPSAATFAPGDAKNGPFSEKCAMKISSRADTSKTAERITPVAMERQREMRKLVKEVKSRNSNNGGRKPTKGGGHGQVRRKEVQTASPVAH